MSKEFDESLYRINDPKAKRAMLWWLNKPGETIYEYVTENSDIYGPDLIAIKERMALFFIELEVKHDWREKFPFKTIHIPYRKLKFMDLSIPTYFVMLNRDCTRYLSIASSELSDIIIKDTIHTKEEKFFEVSTKDRSFNKIGYEL